MIEYRFGYNNLDYTFVSGDSKKEIKNYNNIDLIIGSPPYANNRGYDSIKPENYVSWFNEYIDLIYNSLSDNGVFVLNINSRVGKGVRYTYDYEIVLNLSKKLHFIENIIWNKGKNLVHVNSKRPSTVYENCFVFAKGLKYTWNADEVRTEYSPISINRMKYKIPKRYSRYNNDSTENKKTWSPNVKGAFPKNIINIGSESRRVSNIHTSVYPVKFVDWFIRAFTIENDFVVDLWGGSGTTLISAMLNKRKCVSFEINNDFYNESIKRVKELFKFG